MTPRILLPAIILALSGCATSVPSPRLTAAQAAAIARDKAQSWTAEINYTHSVPRYIASDHSWWVDYFPKDPRAASLNPRGFMIQVDDTTGQAFVVLE